MKISSLDTGFFKLDGGAMFGVVPKTLWQRTNPPDENNLCTWAMRCLLVETGDRKIIIDTGIGDKQDARFRSHFHPHGEATLLTSLRQHGLAPEDITDVLLTHLHFDHVGGAVRYDTAGKLVPTFPAATYWTNELHYQWAYAPNAREKASFLHENFVPLHEAGVLRYIDVQRDDVEWLPGIHLRFLYGHTEAMMMPIFDLGDQHWVYCADLIPSASHIPLPYIISFDVRPLHTLEEKKRLLQESLDRNDLLLFEHDPVTAAVHLQRDAKNRIIAGPPHTLG